MKIQIKRIYDKAKPEDGYRVLVDGLWPRGIAKRDAKIDEWRKELAPSKSLRQWYGHDQARWNEFRKAYELELSSADPESIKSLRQITKKQRLTLLFAARSTEYNNAVILKTYLERS
ncbi:DUF488 domain-containing protein [Salinicola corii]|uniref:DUF488 domain-containing protein n=1 Tax=Salinicola corii TaxID=2606937 RepID=UPI001CA9E79C|nr:DUF488 domain-containing protein [Salinicola corii]